MNPSLYALFVPYIIFGVWWALCSDSEDTDVQFFLLVAWPVALILAVVRGFKKYLAE